MNRTEGIRLISRIALGVALTIVPGSFATAYALPSAAPGLEGWVDAGSTVVVADASDEADRARSKAERAREREQELDEQEQDTYDEGMDSLDEQKWSDAIRRFDEVAKMGRSHASGALYWKAYALDRTGRASDAIEVLADMQKRFPKSRWLGDAKALDLEIRQRGGQHVSPDAVSNEELKLMAINSLMQSSPDQALPLLEKVLHGTDSPRVKERALFVLSQSSSPRALALLGSIARGDANPDLQSRAIKYLGIMGGDANRELLASIYGSANTSLDIKKQILRSFMISGDRQRLLKIAKTESNPDLRLEAIRQLGVMGGASELAQLYRTETSKDIKLQIIKSLFVGGASDLLEQIVQTEKDRDLRIAAIKSMGLVGEKTGPALVKIYRTETDRDIRSAAISALFLQSNAKALVSLAKAEKDPEMKKMIVSKLAIMDSPDATAYMLELLKK